MRNKFVHALLGMVLFTGILLAAEPTVTIHSVSVRNVFGVGGAPTGSIYTVDLEYAPSVN